MKEKQQFTSSGAAKQESNYWPNSKVYFDGMYWIMESVSKGEDEPMKCPNPKCTNETMKIIASEKLTRCRIELRYICYCDAYVQVQYDVCEE